MKSDLSNKPRRNFFERFSTNVAKEAGGTAAFSMALLLVLVWGATGPLFHYSETWQLFINTTTTIITFLMVFLIQKAQNKDSLAIQLKLNELVAAHEMASNRLVNVEGMSEEELKIIQKYYSHLNEFAKQEESLQQSHSIDEAHQNHTIKVEMDKDLKAIQKSKKTPKPDTSK
ncbi:MAG: low affinity iron permease family protein [Chitinophagaceae bacterium]|nr:low affinity iron permease family protein [Chitinophagaceae bacterium]